MGQESLVGVQAANRAKGDRIIYPSKKPASRRVFHNASERSGLVNLGVQLTFQITLEHRFQRDRLDLRSVTGSAESLVASDTHIAHCSHSRAEEFTWVEFARVGGHQATHGASGGQTQVGVDVDFAYAVFDAFDDFFNRDAAGFFDVAALLVDDRQPLPVSWTSKRASERAAVCSEAWIKCFVYATFDIKCYGSDTWTTLY